MRWAHPKKEVIKLLAVEEGGGGFLGGPYSAFLVAESLVHEL
jgi:hypothetical protein